MGPKNTTALTALLFAIGSFGAVPEAQAQPHPDCSRGGQLLYPNLIVNREDWRLDTVSCQTNQPLATGFVAIKNIGACPAQFDESRRGERRGLTTPDDNWVKIYNPYNLDLTTPSLPGTATPLPSLSVLDQRGFRFEVGDGQTKRGRNFTNPAFIPGAKSRLSREDRIRLLQQGLIEKGFSIGGKPDGEYGPATKKAVRAYQKREGLFETGVLTPRQEEELYNDVFIKGGAQGQFVTVDLLVVVDPDNLVDEGPNEADNIFWVEVQIDCRTPAEIAAERAREALADEASENTTDN